MREAWGYRRSLAKDRKADIVEAETYVQPKQSAVLKYAMGEGENVRNSGDVGLAGEHILVPNWHSLQLAQGITRNAFGNLPGASWPASPARPRAPRPSAGRPTAGPSTHESGFERPLRFFSSLFWGAWIARRRAQP